MLSELLLWDVLELCAVCDCVLFVGWWRIGTVCWLFGLLLKRVWELLIDVAEVAEIYWVDGIGISTVAFECTCADLLFLYCFISCNFHTSNLFFQS